MTYILGYEENLLTWPNLLPSNPPVRFVVIAFGK